MKPFNLKIKSLKLLMISKIMAKNKKYFTINKKLKI
jgi:hypothetical protein